MTSTNQTTSFSGLPPREPSAIDTIADGYVHALVELVPELGTNLGFEGHDDRLSDFSPAGAEAVAELGRRTLEALAQAEPRDEVDRVTLRAMRDSLELEQEFHEAGEHLRDLNVLASPLQGIRSTFDMMPTETTDHWRAISARLAAVPAAVDGYLDTLRLGVERGLVAAALQVTEVIAQCEEIGAETDSFFLTLVAGARPDGQTPDDALTDELHAGAQAAAQAYAQAAVVLREEVLPHAPERDGVGRERYQRFSRQFLGATVDLEETYRWGLQQLAEIDAEQREVIREIFGEDLPVTEAFARLDADPERQLHGKDALVAWMEGVSQEAIERLDGTLMEIPQILRRLECCISPTSSGGIYYTGPSLDFSRPGRMWWTVPDGVDTFSTWQERTTVYHEGVPGHHLQVGYATLLADQFNLWRSALSWVSGHGEGWALYSERLMEELGFLADPADRLGMLDGQRLRAARVCLDIGVHLGLDFPAEWIPAGADESIDFSTWNRESAWAFLRENVAMEEGGLRFEFHRYLGWPGQAPSYKVGQRLWEQMRADYLARHAGGDQQETLKQFHTVALSLGSMGLDALADALSRA